MLGNGTQRGRFGINSHADQLRVPSAVLDERCASLAAVTRVELLLIVEASLCFPHYPPHELCTALRDEQAVANECHCALRTVPERDSLVIMLRGSTVDVFIEESRSRGVAIQQDRVKLTPLPSHGSHNSQSPSSAAEHARLGTRPNATSKRLLRSSRFRAVSSAIDRPLIGPLA